MQAPLTYSVDVNLQTGLSRFVGSRESDERRRRTISATCDRNLRTRDVELRAVDLASTVQRNVLDA